MLILQYNSNTPPPQDTTHHITLHYTCHGEGIQRCRVKIEVTPQKSIVLEKRTFPQLRVLEEMVLRKIFESKMAVTGNWRLLGFGGET
jgi:hypothetical protein